LLVRQQLFSPSKINTKVKNQNLVRNTDLSKNTSFHKQGTEAENVDVFTVSVTIVKLHWVPVSVSLCNKAEKEK